MANPQPVDEAIIIRQMNRFFGALDERAFTAMAALMTETAIWRRGGVDIDGPAALLAVMAERPDNRHSCHLLSNQIVELTDADTATLRFYSIAWVHVGAVDDKGVAPLTTPGSIGHYTARFVRRNDAWLLDDLRSRPRFRKEK